jgi:hypothetical protein
MSKKRLNDLDTYSIGKYILANVDLNILLQKMLDGVVCFEGH